MTTPPGGPYGNEYPAQPPHGGGRPGRFNFPSAPSGSRRRPAQDQQDVPQDGPQDPRNRRDGTPPHGQPPQRRPHAEPARPERPVPAADGHGGGGTRDWTPPTARQNPPSGRRPADVEPQQPLVRPYAMTGGRTRPRYQLAIEALVSTTADPVQLQGQLPEHQRICQLCYEVKSVAEVSALLSIPLGVARILVADLAEAGLVAIHQPGHEGDPGGQPDVTLLERVLSGLRKL
ncbi:DUF742 domain-containing protein [Streptomyces sp. MS19]|uniref:DUF742 domain-containing protein n=1 Tax=Streptomyces sp. MS19 TaxID=3385972 RepID=UPI0039A232A4